MRYKNTIRISLVFIVGLTSLVYSSMNWRNSLFLSSSKTTFVILIFNMYSAIMMFSFMKSRIKPLAPESLEKEKKVEEPSFSGSIDGSGLVSFNKELNLPKSENQNILNEMQRKADFQTQLSVVVEGNNLGKKPPQQISGEAEEARKEVRMQNLVLPEKGELKLQVGNRFEWREEEVENNEIGMNAGG